MMRRVRTENDQPSPQLRAVGEYLKLLRRATGLSQDKVADRLGTSGLQIKRIEAGEVDTRSSMMFRLNRLLQGNAQQLEDLMTAEAPTRQDAQNAAYTWLQAQAAVVLDQELPVSARLEAELSRPDGALLSALHERLARLRSQRGP